MQRECEGVGRRDCDWDWEGVRIFINHYTLILQKKIFSRQTLETESSTNKIVKVLDFKESK